MSTTHISSEEKTRAARKPKEEREVKKPAESNVKPALARLQQQIGNRAVQRLLAQRAGEGPFELDDETANRINQQRGGGQALDSTVQENMGSAAGHDFSGVRVHTGPESQALNEQLGARAFTTGQDIFFRSDEYNPGSSGGQELLAHELTHVVQQSTGQVSGGGKMTVNAPGDVYEQEADSAAKSLSSPNTNANVQRQFEEGEEEEEKVQQQAAPEEEEQAQRKAEEEVQMQETDKEEDEQT